MDTLGEELKNAKCSRLVTVFYLEIQKGKEAMKALYFYNILGGRLFA